MFIGPVIVNEHTGKFKFYAERLVYEQFQPSYFITNTFCIGHLVLKKPTYGNIA